METKIVRKVMLNGNSVGVMGEVLDGGWTVGDVYSYKSEGGRRQIISFIAKDENGKPYFMGHKGDVVSDFIEITKIIPHELVTTEIVQYIRYNTQALTIQEKEIKIFTSLDELRNHVPFEFELEN